MYTDKFLLPAYPKASYLEHKDEIEAAAHRVLESGWYILGNEVAAFEQAFAGFLGAAHSIGTGSGTDALHLALRTCGIGPGDKVITVSHTSVATVAAIEMVGAQAVLVDIDPGTFTLDPYQLDICLRMNNDNRIRAVIPVHLYGHPADMPAIMSIARAHGLYVIEDCAQAHGASIGGRKVGVWGDMAAFSFYPTKNLGAIGDAGALVTSNPHLADRARSIAQYGWRKRHISEVPGLNTRLDEIQAAILGVRLKYLNADNSRRRDIANIYANRFAGTPLQLPTSNPDSYHVYHQYVVRSPHRDVLSHYLKEHAIGTAILYPVPIHLQPAYRERVQLGSGPLHHTERACQQILSLPMYPQLTDSQIDHISELTFRCLAEIQ